MVQNSALAIYDEPGLTSSQAALVPDRPTREQGRRSAAEKKGGIPPYPRPRTSCGWACGHWQEMEELGPIRFMDEMAKIHGHDGTPVQVSAGPKTLYIVSHPDDIQQILKDGERFSKGYGAGKLSDYFLRSGIGVLETGDYWTALHQFLAPQFSPKGIKDHFELMQKGSSSFADRLDEHLLKAEVQKSLDFETLFAAFGIRIISRSMFNLDIPDTLEGDAQIEDMIQNLRKVLNFVQARMKFPIALPVAFPTTENQQYLRALASVRNIGEMIINHDRILEEEGKGESSLIRLMRKAELEGTLSKTSPLLSFTHNNLIDQVLSIFFAGHDTTSHLLTMSIYQLSQHPEIQTKLAAELQKELGNSMELTDTSQLSKTKLPYLQAFLDETLRMDSPVPGITRDALTNIDLAGYQIPRGSTVYLSFNSLHRLEEFWPNPEQFNPERFLQTDSPSRHPRSFSPFGGGERLCLGQHFAYQEAKIMLIELLKRGFQFHLAEGANIEPVFAVTIKLKEGLPIVLSR